jgi:hypothetical protein
MRARTGDVRSGMRASRKKAMAVKLRPGRVSILRQRALYLGNVEA